MSEIFRTEDLAVRFGGLAAVDGMDLSIEQGSVHCIIGPNGAGKTTLFNLLTGSLPPSQGRIFFRGEDVTGLKPHRLARKGIARSFQITSIFPELTVADNLRLAARRSGAADPEARVNDVLQQVELSSKGYALAGSMSHGDQRHLDIGIALATDPKLLLLDEPSVGLAPLIVQEILRIVADLRTSGVTVLLVEQNARAALGIADRAYVLENGQIMLEGRAKDLAKDASIQRAYLGKRGKHPTVQAISK